MGMGGVSVAMPFGAESGLANPALITYVGESEISGSATFFFPEIKTKTDLLVSNDYVESDSGFYLMPSVQYATHVGGNFYAGLGAWGVAGMGVDFSDARRGSGLMQMKDDLMIMHIAAPLALKEGGMSIGISPILQVGMLDIEYDNGGLIKGHPFDKEWEANVGAVVGLAYDFGNGLIVGAKYRTPISMTYENGAGGNDLELEQPGEFGVGFSYTYQAHTIAFDYKRIQWGSAAGYSRFGWEDQDVYAVGYQYQGEGWAFRLGYNHGKSPIDTSRTANWQDYLNLLGFPATSEDHYTAGFSYTLNESYALDFAAVYSPKETTHGTVIESIPVNISNKHSEFSLTAQLDYKF
jgi:long-chain fatty acid transport protein